MLFVTGYDELRHLGFDGAVVSIDLHGGTDFELLVEDGRRGCV